MGRVINAVVAVMRDASASLQVRRYVGVAVLVRCMPTLLPRAAF